jgi:hypothetical protein
MAKPLVDEAITIILRPSQGLLMPFYAFAVLDGTLIRSRGIVRELAAAGLVTLAEKGYIGAGQPVLTPYRGRNAPAAQKDANPVR